MSETFAIRLPDGTQVEWEAEHIANYDGDWKAVLANVTPREWMIGFNRLLACVLHGDDVTCELCRNDERNEQGGD